MRRTRLLLLTFLFPLLTRAQSPTLVQHVSCPNGRAAGSGIIGAQSNTPVYTCPLPEPTQAGNTILLGMISDNTGSPTFTVSDDKSNSWTKACSATDSSGTIFAGYYAANVAAGTRAVNIHRSSLVGDMAVSMSEYYNVGALDKSSCTPGSSSQTIAGGSVTPTGSGDLLWQWAANGTISPTTGFSAGSQSNITWQLLGTDLYDGDAVQAGVYNSTSAISPTFTSGTALAFDSVAMAFRPGAIGNAPTKAFRVLHMLHQQDPGNRGSPYSIQFPASGNLIVLSDLINNITGLTSSPSNTWASTGAPGDGQALIYYAANASTSNSMTLSLSESSLANGSTYMLYDITGAAASPLDVDSGEKSGSGSGVGTITLCSGCLTPSASNELVVGITQQSFCTAVGVSSPSGALFDSATDTANSVDGPQSVDQNNGWMHYYNPNTNPITLTWNNTCGTNTSDYWSGRLAAFKPASSQQPPSPPSQLKAVVN